MAFGGDTVGRRLAFVLSLSFERAWRAFANESLRSAAIFKQLFDILFSVFYFRKITPQLDNLISKREQRVDDFEGIFKFN